ncbi:MAG: PilZ domain-containing protein [Spirochaetes bacterium]|nr:PilZ domain-containing protein [Spirochaetota bacterium]
MDNERREYKRVPANLILMYLIQDYEKYKDKNLISIGTPISVDISTGGMQIITCQELPKEAYLKITMAFYTSKEPIEVIGKVMWTKNMTKERTYKSGVRYEKFINGRKDLIEEYIKIFD